MNHSYVTVTDQFCGAGGSSIGATAAGAELKLALNHWKLAIETHNTNSVRPPRREDHMAAVNRYHPDSTEFACATCDRRHDWAGRRYVVCACGTVAWKFQTAEDYEDAVAGHPMTAREREIWRERQAEWECRIRADRERQLAELEALMGRPMSQAVTP